VLCRPGRVQAALVDIGSLRYYLLESIEGGWMKRLVLAHRYVTVLSALALAAVVLAILEGALLGPDRLALLAVFVLLAVMAEIYATWVPSFNWEISSSMAIYLAALFILGPNLAVVSVFLSSLLSELLQRPTAKSAPIAERVAPIAFNVSQLVLAVTVSGWLLRAFGRVPLQLLTVPDFAVAILVFATYLLLNLCFVSSIISLTEQKPFFSLLSKSARQFAVQYLVLCATALLLTTLYAVSVWHVLLALFPLTLVHASFREYVRLQTEARNTFERISEILDARDRYTGMHSREVAELAMKIGRQMGLTERQIEQIGIAGRVHDIGKIAIPDAILLKPGQLTEEEWAKMREHPVLGAQLIQGVEIYAPVVDAVRHEHERWNGTGYPASLHGEQIPLIARVIAAADVYNALCTDRPYRDAYTQDEALTMIREMAGEDLDPTVVDALLELVAPSDTPSSHPPEEDT
jgi:HD-GYP domain-containing protein (c-di-GMP phosphodiesterase class II)